MLAIEEYVLTDSAIFNQIQNRFSKILNNESLVRLSLVAVISNLASFAVAKTIAIKFGPEGIGQYGAFLGLVSLSIVVGTLGMPAVIPSLVGNNATNSRLKEISVISASAGILVVPIISLIIFFVFASDALTGLSAIDLAATGLAGVFTLTYAAVAATFIGAKESAFILGFSVGAASFASVVSLTLFQMPIYRSLGAGALFSLTALGIHWYMSVKQRKSSSISLKKFLATAKELTKSGLRFWIASIGNEVALSIVPAAALMYAGALEAGNFKSGLSITTTIAAVGESWIIYHYYPKLSKAQESAAEQNQIVSKLVRVVIFGLVPIVILSQVFSHSILSFFFSDEFGGAVKVLMLLAPTMLLRALVSGNLAILRSRTMVKELAICEWLFALVILSSLVALSQGLSAIAYAYVLGCSYLVALLASEIYLRRNRYASVLQNITLLQTVMVATTAILPIYMSI